MRSESDMNSFQESLNDLLKEKGISRLKLANAIGISSTTINGYFNNDYYPQIEIAIKMAKFFDCSLDYLFGLSNIKKIVNKNNKSFFENFNFLIKQNNKSIAKTLKELQMSEYNYYRWKSGDFPKTINIISIAKYFDVSIDYLIGYVD